MATRFPANFKKVTKVTKTRAICDLKFTSQDIPGAIIVNERARWIVEKITFGKDSSETHETSSLCYYRTIIPKRSSAVFVRTMFCSCCRVHFCPFILFNCVVALRSRPFMLTSLVCMMVPHLTCIGHT